jgi:3-hydroxybutyrate dehydrogenase
MTEKILKGKCALVTGSVDGHGQAIAVALATAGANIVLSGLSDAHQGKPNGRFLKR